MRSTGWMRARAERTRTEGERGAAAVEFAIIAILLLLVVFGTIQFGVAYNRVQGLNSAGREGARKAATGAAEADIVGRVIAAQSMFQVNDVRVSIDHSGDGGVTWTNVCDDPDSPAAARDCSGSSHPCNAAGVGNLVRVRARVPSADPQGSRYAIAIPLWSSWKITYAGTGTFRCEKT